MEHLLSATQNNLLLFLTPFCMVSVFSIYRREKTLQVPKTVQFVIHEAWICTEINLCRLGIIIAEEELNPRTSSPQPLLKTLPRNALGLLWSLMLRESSVGSAGDIHLSALPRVQSLMPCWTNLEPRHAPPYPHLPQSKDFQLLLCRKMSKALFNNS